jgi:DNA-binding MarR family transcriptional regulator
MRSAPDVVVPDSKADLAQLLSHRLAVVANLLSRSQVMRFEAVSDISLPEWRVLVLVNNQGPLPVKQLAEEAGLDFGQASRLVSRMCENGMIVKDKTDDARSVLLSLTAAGKALHRKLWKVATQTNQDFLETLGQKEPTVLLKALDSLSDAAEESIKRSRRKVELASRRS